jgi:hypothetical protein
MCWPQGGTCLLLGDETKALLETERLVREHIGCRVVHGSKYYRSEGHLQAAFNEQPIQVKAQFWKRQDHQKGLLLGVPLHSG